MTVNAGMDVGKGKHSLLVGILQTLWNHWEGSSKG